MINQTRNISNLCEQIDRLIIACEQIDRLIIAIESLHADLRPEIKKTNTLERKKREKEEIETAAAQAVRNRKRTQKSSA
ncbi:uncharacterized protein METZ01_LOCUS438561 [marine metagenome]|uniref:Uncharacterized protein n=1 Tax=marine metagenome TaxID=408172 RepID=A0A382YQY6_9ZZZZ